MIESDLINGGKAFIAGGRVLVQCRDCGKVVRLDKYFLGSLHICSLERAQEADASRRQAEENKRYGA